MNNPFEMEVGKLPLTRIADRIGIMTMRNVLQLIILCISIFPLWSHADAVFVCTNSSASGFYSCSWPSQWILKNSSDVTDTNKILYCAKGAPGSADLAACSGAQWTAKPNIPNAGPVGVCFGASGGGNVKACSIDSGGGEGWQQKSVVFGTGQPTLTPTPTLAPAPTPALTLSASPSTVASGGSSVLSWLATNATSCTATGGWSGNVATGSSQSIGALTSSTTFSLTCTGAGGSISRSVTVTVTQPVQTLAVFVCTNSSASGFYSCSWPSQWILKNSSDVTDTNKILYCAKGAPGSADLAACSGAQWTAKPNIPNAGPVGVCFGASGGGNVKACSIDSGGGEGWQQKSVVFGTGQPTLIPTPTPTPTPAPSALNFRQIVVDQNSPNDPWMKNIADLNGDGLPDLIVSGANGPIVWYQAPAWVNRVIAQSATSESGSAVSDLDGDGDIDLVVGTTWYENLGNGASWIAHPLPNTSTGTHNIAIADLNGDGKPDIIMRGESRSLVTIFLQVSKDVWTMFNVEPGIGLNGLDVADINDDGRPDIVVGGVWVENPCGDVVMSAWPKHTYATWDSYAVVKAIDMDGDGHADIVLSVSEATGKLSWFKAPADPRTGTWVENVIDTGLDHAHGLAVVDVDRDGMLDVVASEYAGLGRLIVYLRRQTGWQANQIGIASLHNMRAGDLGSDSDIDFFGVNAFGVNPIIVYENMGVP